MVEINEKETYVEPDVAPQVYFLKAEKIICLCGFRETPGFK